VKETDTTSPILANDVLGLFDAILTGVITGLIWSNVTALPGMEFVMVVVLEDASSATIENAMGPAGTAPVVVTVAV
jgi:hypothetical protein